MELKARKNVKPAAAPQTLRERSNDIFNLQHNDDLSRDGPSGAAEAVGVLNAMDEDAEGAEEADLPKEFEYHSEDEGED